MNAIIVRTYDGDGKKLWCCFSENGAIMVRARTKYRAVQGFYDKTGIPNLDKLTRYNGITKPSELAFDIASRRRQFA